MAATAISSPQSTSSGGGTRYLRQPEVLTRVGVSWMTLVRWERADTFPKRRKLGPNVVAWLESEIDAWCASREAANPTAAR
jgi:prophage regulatory protein